MSRIYRSQGTKDHVSEVDLRHTPMATPHPDRPAGGFAGGGRGHAGPLMTDFERREQEARHLLEEARRQAEVIQRDAYHAGFEQGERAGEKLALQKIEPAMQAFANLIAAIQREREALIEQHERELIKVAFAIATQVLHTAIEMTPEVTAGVVEAALGKIAQGQSVTLCISPYDRQLIEQQMRKLHGMSWPPEHLKLESDESVGRGGCRVATDSGDIDATIETQLTMLRAMLWEQ